VAYVYLIISYSRLFLLLYPFTQPFPTLKIFYYNAAYIICNFPNIPKLEIKIIYISKIIFNLTGGIKLNFDLVYYMLSPNVTFIACKTIVLINAIVFLIYRTSLVICLFYKVILICDNKQRLFSGLLLILVRIGFQIVHTALIKPEVEGSKCKANLFKNLITTWGFIGTDFLIEIYLAYKVIILMNIAKRKSNYYFHCTGSDPTSSRLSCNIRKLSSRETYRVFNAVIFWFIIRILMAILLNLITILNTGIIPNLHVTIISTLNLFICIAMSLLLTYSKDIISYLSHLNKI